MEMLRKYVRLENDTQLGPRQIRVIASDATVDRVNDIMMPEGCDISDYLSNPIILAQHDPNAPIGKSTIEIKGGKVSALVEFAPLGISPKADEYCGLAKAGIINAASVGFDPLESEPIAGGGKRYTKWKLLEISLVSVPANPSAVVIGRSVPNAGSKADKHEWKVGASRNLPIDEDSAWDGPAAEKSIFELCDFDGDNPDVGKARKAFLVYDAASPKLKGSYKLPFAKVKGGRMTAVASGIRAAASRLPQTDIPDDVKKKARAVIDHYEGKMSDKSHGHIRIKGLFEVAQLCEALSNLGFIRDRAKWEAEYEGDNSKLPGMLATVCMQAAAALNSMVAEETQEMIDGSDIDPLPVDMEYIELGATPSVKKLRAAFRKAGRALSQANADHVDAIAKCFGKMMDCHTKMADLHDDVHGELEQMMDHGTSLGEHLKSLLKAKKPKPEDDAEDEDATDSEDDSADGELAGEVAHRKRQIEILQRA